jgi:hypothetical protein
VWDDRGRQRSQQARERYGVHASIVACVLVRPL